jgi:hypothetical protein
MDYSNILRRAWRITWKYQALWVFGLMAVWSFPGIIPNLLALDAQRGITGLLSAISFGAIMWASFLWMLITTLVAAVIHAFGHTALVHQVGQSESGIEPTVRSGWEGGLRHFLRVLVITFLTSLPVFVVTLGAMAVVFRAGVQTNWQQAQPDAMPDLEALNAVCGCLGPLICVGIVLGVVTTSVHVLSTRACVLQEEGIWQSIVTGWQMFRANLGSVLLFWGIWLLISIGLAILMMIPLCLLSGLVGGLAILGSQGTSITDMMSGSVWMSLISWVISMAIYSLWCTFYSAAWTLFYQDLSAPALPEEAAPVLDEETYSSQTVEFTE